MVLGHAKDADGNKGFEQHSLAQLNDSDNIVYHHKLHDPRSIDSILSLTGKAKENAINAVIAAKIIYAKDMVFSEPEQNLIQEVWQWLNWQKRDLNTYLGKFAIEEQRGLSRLIQ